MLGTNSGRSMSRAWEEVQYKRKNNPTHEKEEEDQMMKESEEERRKQEERKYRKKRRIRIKNNRQGLTSKIRWD